MQLWNLVDMMKKNRKYHSCFILLSKSLRTPDFTAVTRDEMEQTLLELTNIEDLVGLVEIYPEVFHVTMRNGQTRDIFLYQNSSDISVRKNKMDIDPKLTELASCMCQEISNKIYGHSLGRQVFGMVNPPSPTVSSALKTVKCQFSVKPGFPILALRLKSLFDVNENDDDLINFLHMNAKIRGEFEINREFSKNGVLTGTVYIHFDNENTLYENISNLNLPLNFIYNSVPITVEYIQY